VAPAVPLSAVVVRHASGLFLPAAFVLAFAGLMRLLERWWAGEARFSALLSAASLALVPLALRDLIQALYIVLRQQVLVHPGLSALVAPPDGSLLGSGIYALLGAIDAFTLWTFVLFVIAASVTRGRGWVRPAVSAMAVVLVCALLAAAPSLIIARLFAG
jgi:hypothetical protein